MFAGAGIPEVGDGAVELVEGVVDGLEAVVEGGFLSLGEGFHGGLKFLDGEVIVLYGSYGYVKG